MHRFHFHWQISPVPTNLVDGDVQFATLLAHGPQGLCKVKVKAAEGLRGRADEIGGLRATRT